jgi:hypothetical protein
MFGLKSTTDLDFAHAKRDAGFRSELITRLRRQHAWFRRMGFVLLALTIPIAIVWILSWNHLRSENLPLKFRDAMPMFMFLLMLIVGHGNAAECNSLLNRSKSTDSDSTIIAG